MNKTLPNKIKIRFTAKDIKTAEPYGSIYDCLLATALKRMGFEQVSVAGWGMSYIESAEYQPARSFRSSDIRNELGYKPSVVGKKLTLIKQ